MPTRNDLNAHGFSLIEIIIALAIVSIAVLAISSAMSQHTRAAAGLEQRLVASWVASNEMAKIKHKAKVEKVKTGRRSNTVDMGGRRWRATAQVAETDVERVFLVTVLVRDNDDASGATIATLTSAVSDVF